MRRLFGAADGRGSHRPGLVTQSSRPCRMSRRDGALITRLQRPGLATQTRRVGRRIAGTRAPLDRGVRSCRGTTSRSGFIACFVADSSAFDAAIRAPRLVCCHPVDKPAATRRSNDHGRRPGSPAGGHDRPNLNCREGHESKASCDGTGASGVPCPKVRAAWPFGGVLRASGRIPDRSAQPSEVGPQGIEP